MSERIYSEIIISGFGGQGIVLNGNILGKAAAIYDGKNATLVQSYGPEARGGACSAHIIVSDDTISYPYVQNPNILISMSKEGYENNIGSLQENGLLLTDSDLVSQRDTEKTYLSYSIPATRIAEELGRKMIANIVMLGFLASLSNIVTSVSMKKAVEDSVPKGTEELNLKAFEAGYAYGKKEKL
ncbi:MAG: 2-oxoacid:acceptor oxidoreductase family protein [Thermodesulfobacteriota bacterium]|nr:2-oxoacid:acceptor oxidoreductase family protein [Thermodesulfobacteriota bacterium]